MTTFDGFLSKKICEEVHAACAALQIFLHVKDIKSRVRIIGTVSGIG